MSGPEIVLRGGRVIDPESGFDAVADVAIAEGRITQIGAVSPAGPSANLPDGPADVDAAGLVVTAGFVDLHSHVTDLPGMRLQALDGVTTALELEAGASPAEAAYRRAAAEGRPTNYGFATSWAQAEYGACHSTVRRGLASAPAAGPAGGGKPSDTPVNVAASACHSAARRIMG